MVVASRYGSHIQLAMWVALTGVPTSPRGSTPIPMDQIASVHVISVDAGVCCSGETSDLARW